MRRVLWTGLVIGSMAAAGQAGLAAPPAGEGGDAASESERATATATLARVAAEEYRISLEEKGGERPALVPRALLKWSNPAVGSIHGSVYVWTAKGRPEVVASIFKWYGPKFFHMTIEFHSLATGPLVAEQGGAVVWTSPEPGLTFAPLPGAPAPAASASQRLLQLRALAREFTAGEVDREGNAVELRLLTQPIYRYESTDPAVLDGALFTFVKGTDPEIFLLLEARRRGDGRYGWDYAMARMNNVSLRASHRGREVWSAPELPWPAVQSHRLPYTTFRLDPGQEPKLPEK